MKNNNKINKYKYLASRQAFNKTIDIILGYYIQYNKSPRNFM